MRTAVVIGSTGLIGKILVDLLAADPSWSSVLAISRQQANWGHPKIRNVRFDFENWGDLEMQVKSFAGPTSLDFFCCLGSTIKKAGSEAAFKKIDHDYFINFATMAQRLKAESLLIVSGLGSDKNSNFFYSRIKGQMENAVAEIYKGRLHILKPSLLLGDRGEFRFGERVAILLAPLYSLLLVGPLKKYKPVKASHVALALVKIASKQVKADTFVENENLLDGF